MKINCLAQILLFSAPFLVGCDEDLKSPESSKEDPPVVKSESSEPGPQKIKSGGTTGVLDVYQSLDFAPSLTAEETFAVADIALNSVGQRSTGSLILDTDLNLAEAFDCSNDRFGLPPDTPFEDPDLASKTFLCQFLAKTSHETARGVVASFRSYYCGISRVLPIEANDLWNRDVLVNIPDNECFDVEIRNELGKWLITSMIFNVKQSLPGAVPGWDTQYDLDVQYGLDDFPVSILTSNSDSYLSLKSQTGKADYWIRSGQRLYLTKDGLLTYETRRYVNHPLVGDIRVHVRFRVEGTLKNAGVEFTDISKMNGIYSMAHVAPGKSEMESMIFTIDGSKEQGFKTQSFKAACNLLDPQSCSPNSTNSWSKGPEACKGKSSDSCASIETNKFDPEKHGEFNLAFLKTSNTYTPPLEWYQKLENKPLEKIDFEN